MFARCRWLVVTPLLVAGTLTAADPFAAPESDAVLTVKVRGALAADKELAGLNLLVSVADRVAVVGGGVPDKELADRAEKAARSVKGLKEVKVECWVASVDDPLTKLVGDRLKEPVPAAPPKPRLPPMLSLAPPERRAEGTVTARHMPAAAAGFLLDPLAPVSELPYPTIKPPAVPTAPLDPRFAALTVELKDGTAVIGGRARSHADAWDFANHVRKRPGVGRVVVGQIDTR
jgi:hypothetical protein